MFLNDDRINLIQVYSIYIIVKQITLISIIIFSFLNLNGQSVKESYWTTIPEQIGWTNDYENIFTKQQINSLDSLIADYEQRTSIEIAVITIPSTAVEKDGFNELVFEIAKTWGVGKADKDNGILIGISKGHRSIWIANGIGIEQLMSDSETKKVITRKLFQVLNKMIFLKELLME